MSRLESREVGGSATSINRVLPALPLAICRLGSSVSVHFSSDKTASGLPQTQRLRERVEGSWEKPGQGVKEGEETKGEILGESPTRPDQAAALRGKSQPPSLSRPEARELGFPSPHQLVTGLPWEGAQGQLSLGTRSTPGAQVGALEHTAAGAGAQRHAHSLWRALGLAPTVSSVVSPLLLSSGDPVSPTLSPAIQFWAGPQKGGVLPGLSN